MNSDYTDQYLERAKTAGYKQTPQRMAVVEELAETTDHPTVEMLLGRVRVKYPRFTMASVYRTISMLETLGLVIKHDFNEGTSRIEPVCGTHHGHLIDVDNGDIIELTEGKIEQLQHEIADQLGYELVDYKLEIYARPKGSTTMSNTPTRKLATVLED